MSRTPALIFGDRLGTLARRCRQNSERGVSQFGIVEESPCLVPRIVEDAHGAEPLKIPCRHVGAHRSGVGDDRAEEGDIANVSPGMWIVVNGSGLDHNGPEQVWPRDVDNTIAVAHGYSLGSLQCLSASSYVDSPCRASCAQVGTAAESVRSEDVDVYGAALEAVGNFVGTHRSGRGGLLFDEDHKRLGHDAVVSHRLGRCLGLHGGHEGIKIGNVHENGHLGWVLRIDKRSDVGDAEGAKEFLAFRRSEPASLPLRDVMVPDHGRRSAPLDCR